MNIFFTLKGSKFFYSYVGYTRYAVALRAPLHPDPDFRWARCLGTARSIDGRTVKEVEADDESFRLSRSSAI